MSGYVKDLAEAKRKRSARPADGGPAFPKDGAAYSEGMSLRDHFAGQALIGMLCSMANIECYTAAKEKAKGAKILLHEGPAISAYAHADAMLAQREKS